MWILFHGSEGKSHDWHGMWCVSWHQLQVLTISSMSVSIFSHHINPQAFAFILAMLRCPSCNSSNACFLPAVGITTLFSQSRHPLTTLSSISRCLYGDSFPMMSCDQPFSTMCLTLDSTGSWAVHIGLLVVDGVSFRLSIRKMVSPSVGTPSGQSGNGSWLKALATWLSCPGLYSYMLQVAKTISVVWQKPFVELLCSTKDML